MVAAVKPYNRSRSILYIRLIEYKSFNRNQVKVSYAQKLQI